MKQLRLLLESKSTYEECIKDVKRALAIASREHTPNNAWDKFLNEWDKILKNAKTKRR